MDIDIYQLPGILRRRWIYPAAATAVCGLLALGVAFTQTPTYRASVELILDPAALQNPAGGTDAASAAAGAMATDSQLYVMQSTEVMSAVVDALKLQNDPWLAPAKTGGLMARLLGGRTLTEDQRKQEAIGSLRDDIAVIRADQSLVFQITAKHPNAKMAADIANATADAYLDMTDSSRSGSAQRASASLKAQADDLAQKLSKAQSEVEAYKAAHGLYSTPSKGLVADQQLEDLNQQLVAARTRVEQQKTIYDQANKLSMADIEAGSIPEALQSSALISLRTRYAQLLDAEAQLAANLGQQHPQLKAARSQVASMRSSINGEIDRIRASLKNNYQRAVADRDALQARYNELARANAESSQARTRLAQLESEAQALKDMYQSTLTRAENLGGGPTVAPTSSRIISAAVPPAKPSGAPKLLIVIAGMLLGSALGSALAVMRELLDQFLKQRKNPRKPDGAQRVGGSGNDNPGPGDIEIVPFGPVAQVRANAPVVRTAAAPAQSETQRAADLIRKAFRESTAARVDVLFYPTNGAADTATVIREVAEYLAEAGCVAFYADGVETVAVARPLIVRRGPRVALAARTEPPEEHLLYRPVAGSSLIRQEGRGPVFHLADGSGRSAIAMLPGIIEHADATMMVVGAATPRREIEDLMDSLSAWQAKFLGAIVTSGQA